MLPRRLLFLCQRVPHLFGFPVETNTFANNRLSLMLHNENPVRYMVNHHVHSIAKGASVLYETLKDPTTSHFEGSENAPVMYANKREGVIGTFFDWITQDVSKCLTCVQLNPLTGYRIAGQSKRGVWER